MMKKNFSLLFFLFIFTTLIISCTSSLPKPREEDVRNATGEKVSFQDVTAGRELYINKCSGCHSLYLPNQYTVANWDTILTAMKAKAKISNEETTRIRAYLNIYSNRN